MPSIRANGINLFYEEEGDGYPLVFLHGWPGDHAMWLFQTPVFSAHYRVIVPDLRGHGRSEKPVGGYDMRTLAKDLNGLLDELGVEKAFVVGGSFGGAIGERFVIDYPEKVRAAVWVNSATFPIGDDLMDTPTGERLPFVEVYLRPLRSGGYLQFWNTVWKPTLNDSPPYLFSKDFASSNLGGYIVKSFFEDRYARLNNDPAPLIAIIESLKKETDLIEAGLRGSAVPAMIIAREGGEEQHKSLPMVEYREIPNSGFFCYMEQPEAFNDALSQFLSKH